MPKFLLDILKSRFAILLGGALAAGIIIAALFSLWKSMGLRYLLLVLGGLMLGALFIFGIFAVWQYLERRRGEKMEDALGREPGARRQKHKQAKIAISDLRARWAESMSTFKATGVSIYELPWILIIGEPQSGKTTTLRESGLEFPLGKDALSGVGGTVNLDWWFTNDAVIIDTAGRFTMPVDLAPDEKEWQAFLHLLAKYRPRCPINGVIVTIPVTSLLEDSKLIIEEKANNIREKLRELGSVLNVEFPVYIMITKADLVYGFTEFCASLSAGERAQVLGWSRRDVSSAPFSGEEFSQFFDNLANRLHYWSLRRLKVMSPGDEADRVFSFPGEFRQLKRVLGNYLSLIFSKSSFHSPVFWRGCFFSSGLQEGRAIAKAVLEGVDRTESDVLSKLAASFIKSRAYFINIFYKKVFQERWLVKKAGGARRKEVISRAVAGISALIFFLGAGGLLWSGYKEISDIVNPLELQVRAASRLLTDAKIPHTPERTAEVVPIIDTLEMGRSGLAEMGGMRFLRGREHSYVKDLGRIEDALVEQEVIHLILTMAGEKLSDGNSLISPRKKEEMRVALEQYIGILAEKPLAEINFKPLLGIISEELDEMLGDIRPEIERLLAAYPYGDRSGSFMAQLISTNPSIHSASTSHAKQALSKILEYWKTYYFNEFRKLKEGVGIINKTYAEILKERIEGDEKEDDSEKFVNLIKKFEMLVSSFESEQESHFEWSDAIAENCAGDYHLLQREVTGDEKGKDAAEMTEIIEQHSEVCSDLKQKLGMDWSMFLNRNEHLLAETGHTNQELMQIRKAFNIVIYDPDPFFSPEKNRQLSKEHNDPIIALDIWNRSWKGKISVIEEKILAALTSVSASGWKKDRLRANIGAYLKSMLWHADRDAVKAAMQVVLSNNTGSIGKRLQWGIDPPAVVRTDWLISRFKILTDLHQWLNVRHPDRPGMEQIRASMNRKMTAALSNCLRYWQRTIIAYDPGRKILKTSDWPGFRKKIRAQKGMLLDPGLWPLDSLLTYVTIENLKWMKNEINKSGNTSRLPADLEALEKKVKKTIYVYQGYPYLANLEKSQTDYVECVNKLHDDATLTLRILEKSKGGNAGNYMRMFKALSGFKNSIWRDRRARGEMLAKRLAAIESHGTNLLMKEVAENFKRDWPAFVSGWRRSIGNRFPFGNSKNWGNDDILRGKSSDLAFDAVTAQELHSFFFSQEKGFERLIGRYGLLAKSSTLSGEALELSLAQKNFLQKCLAWKKFLFDDQGHVKNHSLEVVLDTGRQGYSKQGSGLYTTLYFEGLKNSQGAPLSLRFSGQHYKRSQTAWNLRSASEIRIEAKNEETGVRAGMNISGGSLALPAYILTNGTMEDDIGLSEWAMDIKLSDSMKIGSEGLNNAENLEATFISIPVRFIWDETIPDGIIWPG